MDKLKRFACIAAEWIKENRDTVKKAALPVTVAAAVFIFWLGGAGSESAITEEDLSSAGGSGGSAAEAEGYEAGAANGSGGEAGENGVTGSENTGGGSAYGPLYVDISGCVAKPGVYQVESGTRLFQVIEKAGGVTEGADLNSINRAEEVTDGQKIIIYPADTAGASSGGGEGSGGTPGGEGTSGESSADASGGESSSVRININTADSDALQQIPGVGPSTAQKITEYRRQNGYFSSIEEIKNISGIGEKTFEKMKDHLTL